MVYLSGEKIMLLKDLRVRLQHGDYLYTRTHIFSPPEKKKQHYVILYVISHPNKFIPF